MPPDDNSLRIADAIRASRSLGDSIERFGAGSVPVFHAGTRVIKLFPAQERQHFDTELAALRFIEGRLALQTPEVLDAGHHDGWHFIVMTRLTGRPLDQVWDQVDGVSRRTLMRHVGAALQELHSLSPETAAPLAIDWPGFMAAQRISCRARQSEKGLEPIWADALDTFIERWMPGDDRRRVLLHTEIMREHLLAERRGGQWHLTGLVDFEPAMLGAPEYEFASVGVYLTCGEPGLLGEVLAGYGTHTDDGLAQRLLVYTLLHRYSNLRKYLEMLPVSSPPGDLEAVARAWFAA